MFLPVVAVAGGESLFRDYLGMLSKAGVPDKKSLGDMMRARY